MSALTESINKTSMSILDYMSITLYEMIEHSLDELENSENPIIHQMNRRVDEIQHVVRESMEVPHMMEFISMSVMLPIVGIVVFMFGGSPLLTGALSMAGPLYLLRFLQDNSASIENPRFLNYNNT